MTHSTLRALPFALGLLLLAPPTASGQVVTLDEGRFEIQIDGESVGMEIFSIRRSGMGTEASIIAAIEVTHDDGSFTMRPMLEADSRLQPRRYENRIAGDRRSDVSLVRTGRRFTATVISEAGEAAQEYRAGDGTLILEPRVATLYWFLTPMLSDVGSRLQGIEPETGNRPELLLAEVRNEPYRIGRDQFSARIARLEAEGDVREIWFDEQGRVLRVEVPSQGFVAIRLAEN